MDAKVKVAFSKVDGIENYRVALVRNPTEAAAVAFPDRELVDSSPETAGDLSAEFDVPNIKADESFQASVYADNGFRESDPLVLNGTFTPPKPDAPESGTIVIELK